MKRTRLYFAITLAKDLTHEEFEALQQALIAQCEEVTFEDGCTSEIGYVLGSANVRFKTQDSE